MFTAMQSAHLDRANACVSARDAMRGTVSLICNTKRDRKAIQDVIDTLDEMLAVSVPSFAPGVE